jgi:hypothetical protein
VNITWNYAKVPDLNRFEVYKSEDPNSFNFGSPDGIIPTSSNYWLDVNGASDWRTYYYCVRARDNVNQYSNSSEVVMNGDWIVANGVSSMISSMNIVMNGSLIIEPGGSLSLVDISLTLNQTSDLSRGILVQGSGILEIKDIDNQPATTYDASNISTLNPLFPITFIVEALGKLYLNNSFCYGIGQYIYINFGDLYWSNP